MAPDGETVAAPLQGGRLLLADARSGRVLAKPRNGPVNVEALAFSPDGRAVATGDGAGRVSVWDSGGRRQRPLGLHPRSVRAVAFSPDGRTVVSAGADGQIRVWDVATRQITREPRPGHAAGASAIAYAPDGDFVATAGLDGAVSPVADEGRARPRADACAIARLELHQPRARTAARSRSEGPTDPSCCGGSRDGRQLGAPLEGHRGLAWVSFSPNRPSVLAVADDDGAARLWDVRAQRLLRRPLRSFGRGFDQAALSPDGKTLAAGGLRRRDDAVESPGGPVHGPPSFRRMRGTCGSWPSAPMARPSPRSAPTAPCSSGTLARVAGRQAAEGPQRARVECRLQPRRKVDRHRGRGRDGEALGREGSASTRRPFVEGGGEVTEVAFSPDSRTLGVADTNGLTFWAVPARRRLGRKLQVEEASDGASPHKTDGPS